VEGKSIGSISIIKHIITSSLWERLLSDFFSWQAVANSQYEIFYGKKT
jgi:hypothetical protein